MRQRCCVGPLQPVLGVGEDHLATVALNEVADQLAGQVYVQSSCHALPLFARGRRRRQSDLDPQCLQHCQNLADLAGFLLLFKIDHKAQAGSRGKRQVPLRDAQLLPAFSDHMTNFLNRMPH